ncbi:hypothetical protein ASE88_00925 [Sphingomonas sp. Leaf38]|nr:hypothetical protein ASE88_00925 [Sphingomonas sp. Leaf38]
MAEVNLERAAIQEVSRFDPRLTLANGWHEPVSEPTAVQYSRMSRDLRMIRPANPTLFVAGNKHVIS